MKILQYLALILTLTPVVTFAQNTPSMVSIGERISIQSKVLDEERSIQVYLPPSYYYGDQSNFPVVYLMDGDYNFHYDTGLIELLSSVSEEIPEMIVIGISDKGAEKYRNYCKPTNGTEKSGDADRFMSFIEKELKPFVKQNYKTSDYDILIGHSLGGLFATHYFMSNPSAFDAYIAIDPSLWWNDYKAVEDADSVFNGVKELKTQYFISLADTKGMGVMPFVGVLDKYFPNQKQWHFMHFPDESHNSVGLPTIKVALKKLFAGWAMNRDKFMALNGAEDLIDYFVELKTTYHTSFALPVGLLGNVVYYYRDKPTELDKLEAGIKEHFPASLNEFYVQKALLYFEKAEYDRAAEVYKVNVNLHPGSFKSYDGLAQVYKAKGDIKKAKEMSRKTIDMAKKAKVRQWQLNELEAHAESIAAGVSK